VSLRTLLNEVRVEAVEPVHASYDVIERTVIVRNGEEIPALDVLGVGATFTHHVKDAKPRSPGSVIVGSMQARFNSVWTYLAE
jgi:hypothetical protein